MRYEVYQRVINGDKFQPENNGKSLVEKLEQILIEGLFTNTLIDLIYGEGNENVGIMKMNIFGDRLIPNVNYDTIKVQKGHDDYIKYKNAVEEVLGGFEGIYEMNLMRVTNTVLETPAYIIELEVDIDKIRERVKDIKRIVK